MIDVIDEALRQLLIRELPIKNNEIDIAFDQPKREWSARLSRPTLNLFLFDLHENKQLRQTRPMWEIHRQDDSTVVKQPKPLRINLKYLITAWAAEPEDEHRLLSRCLFVLARHPYLPEDILPESLKAQPAPVRLMVGQEEELPGSGDFWSAVDNEWRPGIPCVVTVAITPYQPVVEPMVQTGEIRIGETADGRQQKLVEGRQSSRFWSVGGVVHTHHPLETVRLRLVERGMEIPLQPDGRFVLTHLKAGQYTLEFSVTGQPVQRHVISVPAPDYRFELK
ncbi:MAG: DUF4255 domain-containing protein [Chloroflexi bacterium]|nr:MAG: DUF4255 domain-containing protein [Chloroflexota bacterium]